jgi:plasmid stabilization system protein ParE
MRIVIRREAVADYVGLREWLNMTSPSAAARFSARIEQALQLLAEYPESGTSYVGSTRRLVIANTKYVVIYSIQAKRVVIRNITHTSRKPGYWLQGE